MINLPWQLGLLITIVVIDSGWNEDLTKFYSDEKLRNAQKIEGSEQNIIRGKLFLKPQANCSSGSKNWTG